MRKKIVKLVDHSFVIQRWVEIEKLIRTSFKKSEFNDAYEVEDVLSYTLNAATKPFREGLKHVIVLSEQDEILSAIFCIPTCKNDNEKGADVGWMFTSANLSSIERVKLADAMLKQMHETMSKAGFEQVITDIGTKEGAKFLSQRWGYIHSPIPDQTNRWVKNLNNL